MLGRSYLLPTQYGNGRNQTGINFALPRKVPIVTNMMRMLQERKLNKAHQDQSKEITAAAVVNGHVDAGVAINNATENNAGGSGDVDNSLPLKEISVNTNHEERRKSRRLSTHQKAERYNASSSSTSTSTTSSTRENNNSSQDFEIHSKHPRSEDKYSTGVECITPIVKRVRKETSDHVKAHQPSGLYGSGNLNQMKQDMTGAELDLGRRRSASAMSSTPRAGGRSSKGNAQANTNICEQVGEVYDEKSDRVEDGTTQRIKRPRRSSMTMLSAGLSELGIETVPMSSQALAREADLERKLKLRGAVSPSSLTKQTRQINAKRALQKIRTMREQTARKAAQQVEEEYFEYEQQKAMELAYAEERRRLEEEAMCRMAEEQERLRQELLQREIENQEREAELDQAQQALARMTAMFEEATAAAAAAVATNTDSREQHFMGNFHTPAPPRRSSMRRKSRNSFENSMEQNTGHESQQQTDAQTMNPPAAASPNKKRPDIKIPMAMRGFGKRREAGQADQTSSSTSNQSNLSNDYSAMPPPPCTPFQRKSDRKTEDVSATDCATPARNGRAVFENLMTARKTTVAKKRYQSALSPGQAKRKSEEEMRERELQARIMQRHEEMKAKAMSDKAEDDERSRLRNVIQPRIARMTFRMSPVQLLNEFYPRCRMGNCPDKDTVRRNMRRAMAQYHPDKCIGLPMSQQVEAEVVFQILQTTYEKLDASF